MKSIARVASVHYLEPPMRYAFLLGGKELEALELKLGIARQIDELETELRARDFIVLPMRSLVTKERIEELLENIEIRCLRTTRFPTILVYYAGHHNHEGFYLHDGYYPRERLMAKLSRIRGEKLGIFDCCFAGMMNQYSSRNMTILAATKEDRQAYATMHPGERAMKTILGREILRFMGEHSGSFTLGEMFNYIEAQFGRQEESLQTPEMGGSKIFMFPGKA